jgi:NAD(P)-dependent dehydrogenase (short-subunit alcohol dehydrogenase family)
MAHTNSPSAAHDPRSAPSRSVLLTGASGGVGTATTRLLAEHGFRVFAGVRDLEAYRGPSPRSESVVPVRLDVTDPEQVAAAARTVAEQTGGRLHAVINNAGVIVQGPMELVPPQELHRQFAVNVYGPALVTQAFLPLLRRGQGRLLMVTAPTARVPAPYFGPIGASKSALQAMSHALRGELAHFAIPVVMLEPGALRTEIFRRADAAQAEASAQLSEEQLALYAAQSAAIGAASAKMRLGPPEGLARAVLKALNAARPKPRYVVGSDARMMGLLSRLPLRTQDRLVRGALGLNKANKAARGGADGRAGAGVTERGAA